MDSIGQKLQKTRKLKNLKISYVAKELRISEEILKNFETENSEETPLKNFGETGMRHSSQSIVPI